MLVLFTQPFYGWVILHCDFYFLLSHLSKIRATIWDTLLLLPHSGFFWCLTMSVWLLTTWLILTSPPPPPHLKLGWDSSCGELKHNDWQSWWNKQKFWWPISEVTQLCPTLCDLMDCSLPGSFVHEIFQARVLEWVCELGTLCILATSFNQW